jgi:hypothetical protein
MVPLSGRCRSGEELGVEQLPERLAAQPGALLDGAQQRRGRKAVVVGGLGSR